MDRIIGIIVGLLGWALTCYGAYLYGGWGLCFISIGLPFAIHNYEPK